MPITVTPYIPQYITVHTAPADTPAENVTVSFLDYIKNVASSEIYPTWEESALRANILAQVSFALNRVYTEYYPSRGYPFDITGSTQNDQRFIYGRSTFENVDRLVEQLFTTYIRRIGFVEPLAAKFCNGTTVTCDGLSQWGSQGMAQQGYNSVQILRHYYGNNIELVANAPIRDIVYSYPGVALRRGSSGSYVRIMQFMLARIAQAYPAIPMIVPDGIFGSKTEAAVRKFQSIFALTVDGIVGRATWYQLVYLYVGVLKLSELVSEGQIYTQITQLDANTVLKEGNSGTAVASLQYFISVVGQFYRSIPVLTIDGSFGPGTKEAVLSVQREFGLPETGIVDQATWTRLYEEYLGIVNTALADRDLPTEPEELHEQVINSQYPGYDLNYQPNP